MNDSGNLNIPAEFGKAKRNLLWFCSFSIFLWMVHVPSDGALDSPMLGASAKVDVNLLRAAVWFSCVYCLVGFYREVRNIERINSQAIYSEEYDDVGKSLGKLRVEIDILCNEAVDIRREMTENIERSRAASEEHNEDVVAEQSQLEELSRLGRRGFEVLSSIGSIRLDLNRLSDSIRTDHKILFLWYDKYLSYSMFAISTLATILSVIGSGYFGSDQWANSSLNTFVITGFIFAMSIAIVGLVIWVIRSVSN